MGNEEASLLPYKGVRPTLAEGAFVAPGARVIGDVMLGEMSSIWFGCVIRGDVNSIRIGRRSNIQDGTVVHVTKQRFATIIGDDVTIGHGCVLHGCTIEDGGFVGMSATVMDGAVVEGGAMVAAGALVSPGQRIKRGEVWAGRPARFLRLLKPEDVAYFGQAANRYLALSREYLAEPGL